MSSKTLSSDHDGRKSWKDLIGWLTAESGSESGMSDRYRQDLLKNVVDSVNDHLSSSAAVRNQLQKKTSGTPHCLSVLSFLQCCVTEFRSYLFIQTASESSGEQKEATKSPTTDLTLWVAVKLIDILGEPACQSLHGETMDLLTNMFHTVYTSDGVFYNAMIVELLNTVSDLHEGLQTLLGLPPDCLGGPVFPVYTRLFHDLIPNCSTLDGCGELPNYCLIEVTGPEFFVSLQTALLKLFNNLLHALLPFSALWFQSFWPLGLGLLGCSHIDVKVACLNLIVAILKFGDITTLRPPLAMCLCNDLTQLCFLPQSVAQMEGKVVEFEEAVAASLHQLLSEQIQKGTIPLDLLAVLKNFCVCIGDGRLEQIQCFKLKTTVLLIVHQLGTSHAQFLSLKEVTQCCQSLVRFVNHMAFQVGIPCLADFLVAETVAQHPVIHSSEQAVQEQSIDGSTVSPREAKRVKIACDSPNRHFLPKSGLFLSGSVSQLSAVGVAVLDRLKDMLGRNSGDDPWDDVRILASKLAGIMQVVSQFLASYCRVRGKINPAVQQKTIELPLLSDGTAGRFARVWCSLWEQSLSGDATVKPDVVSFLFKAMLNGVEALLAVPAVSSLRSPTVSSLLQLASLPWLHQIQDCVPTDVSLLERYCSLSVGLLGFLQKYSVRSQICQSLFVVASLCSREFQQFRSHIVRTGLESSLAEARQAAVHSVVLLLAVFPDAFDSMIGSLKYLIHDESPAVRMAIAESVGKLAHAAAGIVEIERNMPVEGNLYSATECISVKLKCEDSAVIPVDPSYIQPFLSLAEDSALMDVQCAFLTNLPLLVRCLDFGKDSAKSFVTLCFEFVNTLSADRLSFLGPVLQSIVTHVSTMNGSLRGSVEESIYVRLKRQLQRCIDSKDVAREEALLSVIGCVCVSLSREWVIKAFSLLLHTYISHPQSFLRSTAFCEVQKMIQSRHMSPARFFVAHQEPLCQYVVSYIHKMRLADDSDKGCIHCLRTLDDLAVLFDFGNSIQLINSKVKCFLPPLVYESTPAASAILKVLSQELGLTKQMMLLNNVRYIFSYIVRNCSPDRLAHAMDFLEAEAGIGVDRLLLAEGPNTYNQLLLHISRSPKAVLNGLVYLSEKEALAGDRSSQVSVQSEKDLPSLLKPKLLGILAFFNSLLLGMHLEIEQKRLGLESLIYLMDLLGSQHLTPVRLKLMAILRMSLMLEQMRDLALKSWSCFVHNIEMTALGTLLNEIVVSLLPLLDEHVEQVSDIFTFLFVKCRSALQPHFNEIYYMPSHPQLTAVNQVLWECHNSQPAENRLQTRVSQLLRDCRHEQADVRRYAAVSLRTLLQSNRMVVLDLITSCESLSPLLSDLVVTVLTGCQDSDRGARLAFAECFGEIGAVDPGKLSRLSRQIPRKATLVKDSVRSAEFAVQLITELIRAFLAAKDTRAQDCCSFALQETLIAYECSPHKSESSQGLKIWSSFPDHHRELLEPHLDSNYKRTKEETGNVAPVPIYCSRQGKSYAMWLCRWLDLLISQIENDTRKMFESCSVVCKHFVQVAAFLLPYLVTEVILQGRDEQLKRISDEMTAVIVHAQKHDDISPSKAEFRHRAAQSVLSLHSSVTQITIHKQTQYWVAEDQVAKQVPGMADADLSALKRQCDLLTGFLAGVPKDALAVAAFHCKSYSHSLLLFEDHFRENRAHIQDYLQILQKLYADMEEPDGLDGLSAVRSVALTISDQILELEMKGKLRDALACYSVAIQEEPHSLRNHKGLVCAFLGLGENFVALRHLNGVLVDKPQWNKELNKLQVEACWQLGEWDTLETCLKLEPTESPEWSVGVGQLLAAAKSQNTVGFEKQLRVVREHTANRLSAVSSDPLSYTRGYEYVIQLHMLQELEDACQSLVLNHGGSDTETTVRHLVQMWSKRLDITQGSFRIREPILRLRRTLLSLIPKLAVKHQLGEYWLTSTKIARKASYMQSAFNCLLSASSYQAPEHWLEKAKCQWKQGETKQALMTLQDSLGKELSSMRQESDGKPSVHARAMLLVGQWMEETALCDTNTILKQYKDLVKEHGDWESSHFFLAKYYDRLRTALEGTEPGKDLECLPLVIRHYGDSLRHGSHYIYQSMPRLLSVWMDFGAEVVKSSSGSSGGKRSALKASNSQAQLQKMNTTMGELIERLAPYQFFTCFPQIVSRICHQNESVFAIIKTLVAKLIVSYPQQALWMMVAVSKSSYDIRRQRCQEIFRAAVVLDSSLNKTMSDVAHLATRLLEVCTREAKTTRLDMNSDFRQLVKLVTEQNFSPIIIPDQVAMTVTLPASPGAHPEHFPFPYTLPSIVGFDPTVEVLASMAKPKKIVIRGSDGKGYTMICKPKDDLRKDCRLMEFNSLVNRCLYRDLESRRRGLHIRTYTVVPLNEQCGLLQWVNDTVALRTALMKLYSEKKKHVGGKELRAAWRLIEKNPGSKEVRHQVMGGFIEKHKPPLLHEWFLRTFPDPASWYESRVAYAHTVAVMSMVGYILGLGDRHTENILLDSTCGDVVHVDFDCLFNKGETFNHPERVPFRLTQNMVDAMGFTGCEGLFRKACEVTLRVLRDQRDPLLSVLKTLIHDPLVEWEKGKSDLWSAQRIQKRSSKSEQTEVVNETGVKKVNDVEKRLRGLMEHNKGLPLSIEGQVHYLIQEATDYDNLCFMYMGWAPFL